MSIFVVLKKQYYQSLKHYNYGHSFAVFKH